VAHLTGQSRSGQREIRPAEFDAAVPGLFTIAVAHACPATATIERLAIDYWALGGEHQRNTLLASPRIAHYPGTPQGRHPGEPGPHGTTLVHVDDEGRARLSFLPTDRLRWQSQRLVVDDTFDRPRLEDLLRERTSCLSTDAGDRLVMAGWTIEGLGPLVTQLRRGGMAAELSSWLRSEFGHRNPTVWTIDVDVEPAGVLPAAWYEQETILGDYLRRLRDSQQDGAMPIRLDGYIDPRFAGGELAGALAGTEGAMRPDVLRRAAELGVDLLGSEAPAPDHA
jgi:hypothetical protein